MAQRQAGQGGSRFLAAALLGALAVGLVTAGGARAQTARAPFAVREVRDVAYYAGDKKDAAWHRLDLYLPRGQKDYPVLVFVHGGFWMIGDKTVFGWGADVGRYFAAQGIGVVIPNYRLAPGVKNPQQARDVARAVAWTVKNIAGYGGNPDQLFLCGHSAGGQLVALLATDGSYLRAHNLGLDLIKGVIAVGGVYDLRVLDLGLGPANRLNPLALVFGATPQAVRDASPVSHVRAGLPPFLLAHADSDMPTLPQMARDFALALRKAGDEVSLLQVNDRNHDSVMFEACRRDDPLAQAIQGFIARAIAKADKVQAVHAAR